MATRRVIGVVPLVTSTAPPWDPSVATHWLFASQHVLSMPSYWRDVSAGEIAIDPVIETPVLIADEVQAEVLHTHAVDSHRARAAETIRMVLAAAGQDALLKRMATWDGLVLLCLGFPVNAGACAVKLGQRWVPTALLDHLGEHDFIAHEVGHVLGLDHPHDPRWLNPNALHGEYGDPACVMSARSYRGDTAKVTVTHPAAADSGIPANAPFWNGFGPGVSPTTLWRYLGPFTASLLPGADHPEAPAWVEVLPRDVQRATRTLTRAGLPGLTVLAIPDPAGPGYVTVEYRSGVGWDRVLAQPGTFVLDGDRGVVLHRTRDLGTVAEAASGYPKLQRVTYDGTARGPLDGRQYVANLGVSLQVLDGDADHARVEFGIGVPRVRAAHLEVTASTRVTAVGPGVGPRVTVPAGPRCDPLEVAVDVVSTETVLTFRAQTRGVVDPEFTFTVTGRALRPAASLDAPDRRLTLTLPARTHLDDFAQLRTAVVPVTYRWWGNELRVCIPGGLGQFTLPVAVAVRDRTLKTEEVLHDERREPIASTSTVLPASVVDAMEECHVAMRQVGERRYGKQDVHPLDLVARDPAAWRGLDLVQRVRLVVGGMREL